VLTEIASRNFGKRQVVYDKDGMPGVVEAEPVRNKVDESGSD
jgi:hypothetical protein